MFICVLLTLLTVGVYLPVFKLSFVNFDDISYITGNPVTSKGLTWEGVRWAVRARASSNWHPLTWISHMADCQVYGLRPAGHHATNLAFHVANTLLLFLLLRRLTRARWRSAVVAGLFALHPLHVESVAWVSERKDVLSTFFGLLCLHAYARYGQASSVIGRGTASRIRRRAFAYLLSLLFFGLGLMSKPMLVTWPCVMFLLDYWPLRRFTLGKISSLREPVAVLVWEKIPFFVLSAGSCAITVVAQGEGGALASLERVSLGARIANAVVSYVRYLEKLVWPTDLAVVYPNVTAWPAGQVLLAGLVLVAFTTLTIWQGRERGYLLMGWFWYLGTLVPVIGLVKVGDLAMADRYMYIPAIGLFILFAWGIADVTARWTGRTLPLAAAAVAMLAGCAGLAHAQILHWQDTESLFRHALAVTEKNPLAYINLGFYYAQRGQPEQAGQQYQLALVANPNFAEAWNGLGRALAEQKQYKEAVADYEAALRLKPHYADAEINLGDALFSLGKTNEAVAHFLAAIKLTPEDAVGAVGHFNLGYALYANGRVSEAVEHYQIALRLDPRLVRAHQNLGGILARQGRVEEAMRHYREAVRMNPQYAPAYQNLAALLAEQGRFQQAAEYYLGALKFEPTNAPLRLELARTLAKNGKLEEAVKELGAALVIEPHWLPARRELGEVLLAQGKPEHALEQFSESLRIDPDDPETHLQIALLLTSQGNLKEAVGHYRRGLVCFKDTPEILNNVAWILATNPDAEVRNGAEAVTLAESACRLTGFKRAVFVGTLAAAYAEAGRFGDAVATAEKARSLAEAAKDYELANTNSKLRELYRTGNPWREPQ